MALEINYIRPEAPAPKVTVNARLCISKDGTKLVPDGHPDAAFLFCVPGRPVDAAEFAKYEVVEPVEAEPEEGPPSPPASDGEFEADAQEEPEAEGEPEAEEEEKPKRKRRAKAKDKAVKGPEGDK